MHKGKVAFIAVIAISLCLTLYSVHRTTRRRTAIRAEMEDIGGGPGSFLREKN